MPGDHVDASTAVGKCPTCRRARPEHAGGDKLTGLPDRWHWDEAAENTVDGAQRRGETVSLLLVDVDRFKQINDDIGHPAGDAVLAALSRLLQSVLRSDTVLGRYGGQGGDEFLALLPRTTTHQARRVVRRLHHEIAQLIVTVPTASGDHTPLTGFSASIGVATGSSAHLHTVADLIQHADAEMRRSKHGGRERQSQLVEQRRRCSDPGSQTDNGNELRLLLSFTQRLSGRWTREVLLALSEEPRRYTDLLSTIRSDTPGGECLNASVLNRTLRRLERDGLIHRREHGPGCSRAVRYALTPTAHELLATLSWRLSSNLQAAIISAENHCSQPNLQHISELGRV